MERIIFTITLVGQRSYRINALSQVGRPSKRVLKLYLEDYPTLLLIEFRGISVENKIRVIT